MSEPKHVERLDGFNLPTEYLGHVWVWAEVSDD